MQLAEVGHARVGGQVGLAVDHLLQGPAGLRVAPELDEGVDDGAERRVHRRRQRAGAQGVAQAGPEVVARELERAALGQRAGVGRAQRERAVDGALGARVEARVAGLAHLLQVRAGQQRPAVGALGRGADGGLQDGDALVGRRIGRRRRRQRGGCLGGGGRRAAARGEDEDGERDGEGRDEADEDAAHGWWPRVEWCWLWQSAERAGQPCPARPLRGASGPRWGRPGPARAPARSA